MRKYISKFIIWINQTRKNFLWGGKYENVKDYVKNCHIFQQIYKNIKKIISKGPGKRFVVDLLDIDKDINNTKRMYKYILNIIDHYSKLVDSYPLKKLQMIF